MVEISFLKDEKGANKFGTCGSCGKNSGDDPLMKRIKVGSGGNHTSICLCYECYKKMASDIIYEFSF